jgi:hypothetical protein
MTKISKKSAYPIKNPIVRDYFVGTDSENNGKTVNFGFGETARLINSLNGTSILNYMFLTDVNIPLRVLTEGVFLSQNNETLISGISKLFINKKNHSGDDLSELFSFISVNRTSFLMTLRNSANLNNTVYFNITGVSEFSDYYTFDMSISISNSSLSDLVHYNIYFFDFILAPSDVAITLPEFNNASSSKIYEDGELQIFRKPGTEIDLNNKEPNIGDYCIGFVEGQFINTNYLGPDKTLLTSFYI